jgi:hypothetical protein
MLGIFEGRGVRTMRGYDGGMLELAFLFFQKWRAKEMRSIRSEGKLCSACFVVELET